MIRQKNQPIAVLVLFALALSPITLGSVCFAYPTTPFGGGGGDAFPQLVANLYVECGPFCGGIIAWAIGKAIDYGIEYYNNPAIAGSAGCMGSSCVGNASMNQGGVLGGGGGDGF